MPGKQFFSRLLFVWGVVQLQAQQNPGVVLPVDGGVSIAGMVFAQIVSRVLRATNNNYFVPFAIAATSYSLALLLIHLLLPKLEPMTINQSKFTP